MQSDTPLQRSRRIRARTRTVNRTCLTPKIIFENTLPILEVFIDNLKFYLEIGCVITKINSYVEFDHSRWLEKYIMFNTSMRAKAKNDFEKEFFKLMNNSYFGKTMESVKKRKNFKIHTDEKLISKNIASSLT